MGIETITIIKPNVSHFVNVEEEEEAEKNQNIPEKRKYPKCYCKYVDDEQMKKKISFLVPFVIEDPFRNLSAKQCIITVIYTVQ